jgi:hypothetical protein
LKPTFVSLVEQPARTVVHQPGQSPGKRGTPSDAEVVFLAVAHFTLLTKLFERLYLLGEPLDVIIDGDRCGVLFHLSSHIPPFDLSDEFRQVLWPLYTG